MSTIQPSPAPQEEEDWERLPSIPRAVHATETAEYIVLREILRHYSEFREYVAQGNSPDLEHTYLAPVEGVPAECPGNPKAKKEHEALEMKCVYCGGGMRRVSCSFNFWDLHRGMTEVAPRKREAIMWNVIYDKKQKDVAKIMKITTVTVGQYVMHGMKSLISAHVLNITEVSE